MKSTVCSSYSTRLTTFLHVVSFSNKSENTNSFGIVLDTRTCGIWGFILGLGLNERTRSRGGSVLMFFFFFLLLSSLLIARPVSVKPKRVQRPQGTVRQDSRPSQQSGSIHGTGPKLTSFYGYNYIFLFFFSFNSQVAH